MVLEKQTTDYNCGVFALKFLLELHGIDTPVNIEPTEESGTSHQQIFDFLTENEIQFGYEYNSQIHSLRCPAIVNHQYCDKDGCDGHYSVMICRTRANIILYNPAIGEIEIVDKNEFVKNWYSNLYGAKWHLTIDQ